MSNTKQCPECRGAKTETREHFVDTIVSIETQHLCSNCAGTGCIEIDEIDRLESSIQYDMSQIKGLQDRYGRGVRPAWVGEEIGILMAQIATAKKKIAELESNQ